MKKKMLMAGCCLAIFSHDLFAADEWFVGIGRGTSKVNSLVEVPTYSISSKSDSDIDSNSLTIGKYFGDNIAVELSIFDYDNPANTSSSAQSLAAKYIFDTSLSVKPMVGFAVAKYKHEMSSIRDYGLGFDGVKFNGTGYGPAIGAIMSLSKNVDLEATYSYIRINDSRSFLINGNAEEKLTIKSVEKLGFGLSYKF